MPRRVIALHGDPGVGKDATAEILTSRHNFVRLAFADRVKEACVALDPLVDVDTSRPWLKLRLSEAVQQHGWDEAKRRYPEVRRTQRRLATEVVRDMVDARYWVSWVEKQLMRDYRNRDVVVTDLRFPNEAWMLRDYHAAVWWIHRRENEHLPDLAHSSDQWHPHAYVRLDNNGSLDDLAHHVERFVNGQHHDHLPEDS